jgi:hypothetical protein
MKFKNLTTGILSISMAAGTLENCCASEPNIDQQFMTEGDCMKTYAKIDAKRIMIHSTADPGTSPQYWHDRWNCHEHQDGEPEDYGVDWPVLGVHFFVDDNKIIQTLPLDCKAWHCGAIGNTHCLSVEMCEPESVVYPYYDPEFAKTLEDRGPDEIAALVASIKQFGPEHPEEGGYDPTDEKNLAYFNSAVKNDVELCAYLFRQMGINPAPTGNLETEPIISHKEGRQIGIASNHQDPEHWWGLHGLTMRGFRWMVYLEWQNQVIDAGEQLGYPGVNFEKREIQYGNWQFYNDFYEG